MYGISCRMEITPSPHEAVQALVSFLKIEGNRKGAVGFPRLCQRNLAASAQMIKPRALGKAKCRAENTQGEHIVWHSELNICLKYLRSLLGHWLEF